MSDNRRNDDEAGTNVENNTENEAAVENNEAATEQPSEAATEQASEVAPEQATVEHQVSGANLDADDEDALASVGMFLGDEGDQISLDDIELPQELQEPSFAEMRHNSLSWIVFGVCMLTFVLGGAWIRMSEDKYTQIELMWEGGLERHKRAHIIELKEKYRKEDHYCHNRYGEFKMIYSPRDAEVRVTQFKYKESIDQFMQRYVRGDLDNRTKLSTMELKKFKDLTTDLKKNVVVAEQNIKNLPISSRSNTDPEKGDKSKELKMKSCTDSADDYCTFVYTVSITKEKYRPRHFLILSEYSPEAPGIEMDGKIAKFDVDGKEVKGTPLVFKNTGPNVYEVVWPGADLQPTPELFQEQYVTVMTRKVKCTMKDDGKTKEYKEIMALPEIERYQKLYEEGMLGMKGKTWTLAEWRASIAELQQHTELWTAAQKMVDDCKCNADPPCWKSYFAAPAQN